MIFLAALCNVVQQHRNVERAPGHQILDQTARKRVIVLQQALFDFRQNADRAQQVLVHRIVVIHVELHQGDDAAKLRHETAQHSSLAHASQDRFRIVRFSQDIEEYRVGLGVLA